MRKCIFFQTYSQGTSAPCGAYLIVFLLLSILGNNARDEVEGPWRGPCHLKKPFKGLRQRLGSCCEECKRTIFSPARSYWFALLAKRWFFTESKRKKWVICQTYGVQLCSILGTHHRRLHPSLPTHHLPTFKHGSGCNNFHDSRPRPRKVSNLF